MVCFDLGALAKPRPPSSALRTVVRLGFRVFIEGHNVFICWPQAPKIQQGPDKSPKYRMPEASGSKLFPTAPCRAS